MTKEEQYRQLICDVRKSYHNRQSELIWCEDCQEINLWTYWQGCGHLDAQIMLVGQDWGCPSEAGAIMQNISAMKNGLEVACYMDGNDNPTDTNLIELFHSIDIDIRKDDPRLFFTNFVMGYRTKGISGNFKARWAAEDAPYFKRLVDIIQPKVILCLGKATLKGVLGSFDRSLPKYKSYNQLIESSQNPISVQLSNGKNAYVFALAHCGVMGTLNRNRGSSDKLELNKQKNDWHRIRPFLWHNPNI